MLIPAIVTVEGPEPEDCCISEDARSLEGEGVGREVEVESSLPSLSFPPLPLPPPDFGGRVVVVGAGEWGFLCVVVVFPGAEVVTEEELGGATTGGTLVEVTIVAVVVVGTVGGTVVVVLG